MERSENTAINANGTKMKKEEGSVKGIPMRVAVVDNKKNDAQLSRYGTEPKKRKTCSSQSPGV